MNRSFALALAFTCAACGISTAYIPLNASPRPLTPRTPESVEVFQTNRPERPFVEVGSIEVQQEKYNSSDASEIVRTAREEAGRRGCDAMIITGANDATEVSGSSGPAFGSVSSKTLKGYRATCIVYKDAPAPATSAPTTTVSAR